MTLKQAEQEAIRRSDAFNTTYVVVTKRDEPYTPDSYMVIKLSSMTDFIKDKVIEVSRFNPYDDPYGER